MIRFHLGIMGATFLAVGCQVISGISDYEAVDGLGGGGTSPTTTTMSGPGAGGTGGTGGTIVVDPPTVVWRYTGISGAGSFTRGYGLGVGSSPTTPMVVGTARGMTAGLPGFDVSSDQTLSIAFEVMDGATVQNEDIAVAVPSNVNAAFTAASKSGPPLRLGLKMNNSGSLALTFDDGGGILEAQFNVPREGLTAETLGTTATRTIGGHVIDASNIIMAGSFLNDITINGTDLMLDGDGLHAAVVRSNSSMSAVPWQVVFEVTADAGGDIWIEDFAFVDDKAIVVGRYTGANNGFEITNPGPTLPLPATADNGTGITDSFYVEIDADSGALLEARGIVRPDNQAFTEVERTSNALFIGGHYNGSLAFGAVDAATSSADKGFVARLDPSLGNPQVIEFAGGPGDAHVSAMTALGDNLYVAVDCSGSIDVRVDDAVAYTTSGGDDDLCFFAFDTATSPPTITTAARFDGDVMTAEDMIVGGGDVFITGTYSGRWDLPEEPRFSDDDALYVLRLALP